MPLHGPAGHKRRHRAPFEECAKYHKNVKYLYKRLWVNITNNALNILELQHIETTEDITTSNIFYFMLESQ